MKNIAPIPLRRSGLFHSEERKIRLISTVQTLLETFDLIRSCGGHGCPTRAKNRAVPAGEEQSLSAVRSLQEISRNVGIRNYQSYQTGGVRDDTLMVQKSLESLA